MQLEQGEQEEVREVTGADRKGLLLPVRGDSGFHSKSGEASEGFE